MSRIGNYRRETRETRVNCEIDLDGGEVEVSTPVPFFTHMINQLGSHGHFGLAVEADGDVEVDAHHLVEDVGICLGKALSGALGSYTGIARFADRLVGLDESLVQVAVDLCGRGYYEGALAGIESLALGTPPFYIEHAHEFFRSFAVNGGLGLHILSLRGGNTHHQIEAAFKGVARALRDAVSADGCDVPSTKGVIGG